MLQLSGLSLIQVSRLGFVFGNIVRLFWLGFVFRDIIYLLSSKVRLGLLLLWLTLASTGITFNGLSQILKSYNTGQIVNNWIARNTQQKNKMTMSSPDLGFTILTNPFRIIFPNVIRLQGLMLRCHCFLHIKTDLLVLALQRSLALVRIEAVAAVPAVELARDATTLPDLLFQS